MRRDTGSRRFMSDSARRLPILVRAAAAAVLISSILAAAAAAQEANVVFERLSLEHGLSQSIVECIIQDRTGFMWFATQDGLNRYDGYQFTVLREDPRDANSLSHDNILSLCEDHLGFIWVGTFNAGLNCYDPGTERFTRFRADRENPKSLSDDYIRTIYEDSRGNLWVGTGIGLNRYDRSTGTFERFLSDPSAANTLSNNAVRKICEDRAGSIWIGTDDGLNKLDPRTGSFTRYRNRPDDPTSLTNSAIRALFLDTEGALWVGTESGLNCLDLATGASTRYRHDPNNPHSLSCDSVYSILEDSRGTLWIGTKGGGLNRFDRKTERFFSYMPDPSNPLSLSYREVYALCEDRSGVLWIGTWGGGIDKVDTKRKFLHYKHEPNNQNSLSHDIVWSILEDEAGILWIGTHGGGLNRLDRRTNQYRHYLHDPRNPNSLSNNFVRFIIEDRSRMLWIGTDGGGVDRFDRRTGRFTTYRNDPRDPGSLSQDEIRCLYEDRRGVLWIGTNGGGLNRLDPGATKFIRYRHDPLDSTSLSNDYVRMVYEDSSGVYWVGTQGGGLNRFDPKTGRFSAIRANPKNPGGIGSDFMMQIHESRSGLLWISTWGGGLVRFDPAKGTFKSYTTANGLSRNAIYGCLEDAEGNLWISTNSGLSRFDPKTETFKNYSAQDGLQSTEFNSGSFFKSASGEMFFGGINGFNAFYPERIKDNPYVPPIVITSFSKLNRKVNLETPIWETKHLRLSHSDYVFSFEFAALDYTAPTKNLYAYKMEGLDRDWFYTDATKRFANYTTLPAGKYVFRVKGSNNDGVWNETGAALRITIMPPFWGTWWFRAVVIVVIVGIALFLYRRQMRTVRLATELKAAHDAQMSIMPHDDPQVEGFEISGVCIPASEVGGDFFDYFWLDEGHSRFGMAIGDVSGKAMKAAMIAVMSSGMIYSWADESFSPGEAMTLVNRPLYAKTTEQVFTALCLGALDVAAKTFTFSNGGAVDPLLKTRRSTMRLTGTGSNLPLGAMKDTVYGESTIALGEGDVLVLFTDGLPDAWNNAQDFYEYDRVRNLVEKMDVSSLSAKEIKDRIIEDVRRFAGGAAQHDDMTVVVIKGA